MSSDIKLATQSTANFTITLASLASGSGRQSTLISNASPGYPAALIFIRIKSGAGAPTANTTYNIYLLRNDGTIADDGAGASDAAITILNAPLLGVIGCDGTASKNFYGIFDTAPLGPLGTSWGIAVVNQSGGTISTTEADHQKDYVYYNPQSQ